MTTGCIEYWLMLHYEMYAPPIQTVADKARVINRLFSKEPLYKKGDSAITAKIARAIPRQSQMPKELYQACCRTDFPV